MLVAEIFPLHDAAWSKIFLLHFAAGSQISPLHYVAGSPYRRMMQRGVNLAAGSQV
jgi:hypothetical protein